MYRKFVAWCAKHSDKLIHFTVCLILFQILCAFLGWDLALFLTFAIGAFKELADEFIIPGGCCDLYDMVADVAGMLVGLLLFFLLV